MNKAYKFRLYPNKEQQVLIGKTFGCVRFAYNRMLFDRIDHYEKTGKSLNNTPATYKSEFEWLKEVDSLALANAQMNLNQAYKHFFRDKKVGFPKFKSKKDHHQSYTTNLVNGNIRILDGAIMLPKLKSVRMKQHREIPADYRLKSVTVSKTPSGKYFASLLYEYEHEAANAIQEPKRFIGLDFSMKAMYVGSDGQSAEYPKYYDRALEKLKREQQKLQKCEKGSKNRNKQRIKVARIHEQVANQRKDFQHKQSRQIANATDVVCIEDLDMKAMSQTMNFGKSVADNGYGKFVSMLEYKLNAQGKQLVKIDKWYPSSKRCSGCGHINPALKLSERTYECVQCGMKMDRDYNASINIKNEGMRMIIA